MEFQNRRRKATGGGLCWDKESGNGGDQAGGTGWKGSMVQSVFRDVKVWVE